MTWTDKTCPACSKDRSGKVIAIVDPSACVATDCPCRCHPQWASFQAEKIPQPALIDRLNEAHPSYSTTRGWPA